MAGSKIVVAVVYRSLLFTVVYFCLFFHYHLLFTVVYCFAGWTHMAGRNIVVAFHCSMQPHVCQVYISSDDVDVVDDEKNDQLSKMI